MVLLSDIWVRMGSSEELSDFRYTHAYSNSLHFSVARLGVE